MTFHWDRFFFILGFTGGGLALLFLFGWAAFKLEEHGRSPGWAIVPLIVAMAVYLSFQ